MNYSNTSRRDAAIVNLAAFKSSREAHVRLESYIIPLAFTYGLQVDEIAAESGLSVERVQEILRGM